MPFSLKRDLYDANDPTTVVAQHRGDRLLQLADGSIRHEAQNAEGDWVSVSGVGGPKTLTFDGGGTGTYNGEAFVGTIDGIDNTELALPLTLPSFAPQFFPWYLNDGPDAMVFVEVVNRNVRMRLADGTPVSFDDLPDPISLLVVEPQ